MALLAIASSASTLHAQTQTTPPACHAADLDLTFRFANDPPSTYTLAILSKNISHHACTLAGHDLPTFVTIPAPPEPIKLCEDCDRRLPARQPSSPPPLLLQPEEIAHQTYRWTTVAAAGEPPCRQPRWMTTQSSTDHEHAIFLAAPTLLPAICSQVDVEGYTRGSVFDPDDSLITRDHTASHPPLRLSAAKPTVYPGEFFSLQAESGDAPSAPPILRRPASCPAYFLRQRSADGYTRIDEFHSPQIRCMQEFSAAVSAPALPLHITTTFDSLAHLRSLDLGDNTVQLLELFGSPRDSRLDLAESNRVEIHLADATAISRRWGPAQAGVRVDLTLDKLTYALGEDIPLHIATQVVSTAQPVYGEPFVRRGDLLGLDAASFHLAITSTDGPEPGADKPDNLYRAVPAPAGPLACPKPLATGAVIPLERSLKLYDLLPNIPGTYKLQLSWSPYTAAASACPATAPDSQPFTTVYSNPLLIHITGSPSTPEEVASLPEFTAWQSAFGLIDTPAGRKSALLDHATNLEWLRLSITANKSQETLSHMMAPHRPLDGWRFASQEEVLTFFKHFTGSSDGRSKDPAIERELQDLMGGPLSSPKSTFGQWSHKITTGNIAGFFAPTDPNSRPVSAPRFQYHFAVISEELREGLITASIDPNRIGWVDGDRTSPATGTFLVRSH